MVASGSSNTTATNSSSVDRSSNDGSDGGGKNVGEYEYNSPSPLPLSPFTGEKQFTHATQDEDHGSRAAGVGIGVIRKTFEGGQQMGMSQSDEESLAMTFSSMSMNTEYSSYNDSQNGSNFNTHY